MLGWFAILAVMGAELDRARARRAGRAVDPSRAHPHADRQHQIGALAVLAGVFLTRDRRRGAVRRHGPFRQDADSLELAVRSSCRRWCCNYFGQGAMLIENPAAISNPFYLMAPAWSLLPLVIIATAATVIASQAVISGVFSVTTQAVSLGLLPAPARRAFLGRVRRSDLRAHHELDLDGWRRSALVVGFGSSAALARRLWPGGIGRHDHRDAADLEPDQIPDRQGKPPGCVRGCRCCSSWILRSCSPT